MSNFDPWDIFMILFTLIIAFGVIRQLKQPKKNLFALGFGTIALLVFLFLDVMMIRNWMGLL